VSQLEQGSHGPKAQECGAMKIMVKAEKAGQVVAQCEFDVSQEDIRTSARKAFVRLLKVIPEESSLFDDDVRLKFEKLE
jgi:hypothetical protein